jgi:tetratricopeptide (TPR) repeat protein
VVEAYGRVGSDVGAHRLAHALVFGDVETRAHARSVLETADYEVLNTVYRDLDHSGFMDDAFSLLEVRLRRAPPNDRPYVLFALARKSFQAGKVRRALEVLDDPRMVADPQYARFVYCGPYAAFARGLSVPPARLDRTLSLAAIDSAPGHWIGCLGAWAADRGRWKDHARVIRTLREMAASSFAETDSASAQRLAATARALEGYAAWKRGKPEEAFRILDAARPHLAPFYTSAALPSTWWLGRILLELGRPAEAVPYFRALTFDPLASYELARIYQALGENAKARAEYEYFLDAWKGADPELRPMVAEAQKALARLGSARRE